MISSTNFVLEVSNFLTFFLENDILTIKEKDEIITGCLNALNEFCTG